MKIKVLFLNIDILYSLKVDLKFLAPPAGRLDEFCWPMYTDLGRPMYTDLGRPMYTDLGRPMYTDLGRPMYTDLGRPMYTDLGRPMYTDLGRPGDTFAVAGDWEI